MRDVVSHVYHIWYHPGKKVAQLLLGELLATIESSCISSRVSAKMPLLNYTLSLTPASSSMWVLSVDGFIRVDLNGKPIPWYPSLGRGF